jgi:hypothetical protein
MKFHALTLFALCLLLAIPGSASPVTVFNNYPPNGTLLTSPTIALGYKVSDSFTLSSPATLVGVNIALWTISGDTATALDWSIGSNLFLSDIAFGNAAALTPGDPVSFSGTPPLGDGGLYDVALYTFALPSSSLGAGTYYLTLQNASSLFGVVYWDQNNDPNTLGITFNQSGPGAPPLLGAESFQILGSSPAPEPASFVLFGSGLLVAGLVRRKTARR